MSYNLQKKKHRAKARAELKDSYIKRILRKKRNLMAEDCTQEIIEETRQSIIDLRKKKELNKNLISSGKYKCSRCFIIKSLDMFYKDSSKNCGFSRYCKECASVSKTRDKASKKYNKRIRENLEDVYIKRVLYREGVKLEDVTGRMITKKRKSIQEHRDKTAFKEMLLKEDKRICPSCNKIKGIRMFSKPKTYCKKCYNLEARKRNIKITSKNYKNNIGRIIPEDYIKKCPCCKKTKKSIYFYRGDYNKDGLSRNCKGCSDLKSKKYKPNASEQTKENKRIWARKYLKIKRDTLADSYVKQLLCKRSFLRSKDIPQELIEAKRGQLKLKRILENK